MPTRMQIGMALLLKARTECALLPTRTACGRKSEKSNKENCLGLCLWLYINS